MKRHEMLRPVSMTVYTGGKRYFADVSLYRTGIIPRLQVTNYRLDTINDAERPPRFPRLTLWRDVICDCIAFARLARQPYHVKLWEFDGMHYATVTRFDRAGIRDLRNYVEAPFPVPHETT